MNALQLFAPVVVLGLVIAVWAALVRQRGWLFFGLTLTLIAQSNPGIIEVLKTTGVGTQWLIVPTVWLIAASSVGSLGFGRFRSSLTGLALLGVLVYICVFLPVWSINGFESIRRALPFAVIVVLGYGCLGGALADSEKRDALLNYVVAAFVSYAIYQIATVAFFGLEATLSPEAAARKNMLGYGRLARSDIMNACGLGHSAGTTAVIAIVRAFSPGSRRRIWGVAAIIALAAVVLTGTRGAVIATIAALCMLLIVVTLRRPTVGRWVAVGLLTAGGAVYFRMAQEAIVLDPKNTALQEFEDSRWRGVDRTFEMASGENWNPVVGAGAGAATYLGLQDDEAHIETFIVRVWFEWGLGGVVYLLVLLAMSASVLRYEMSTGRYLVTPWIAYMWASSMAQYGPSNATGETAIFLVIVSSAPRSHSSEPGAPVSAFVRPAETVRPLS